MGKIYSSDEVKKHNKATDLWLIIDNKIYDVTKFQNDHPGSPDALISVAGTDATQKFRDVGHSKNARELLKKYYVGELAVEKT